MDPLIVTGLVSLGSRLVNRLMNPPPAQGPEAFALAGPDGMTQGQAAAQATAGGSELGAWLSLNGVAGTADLPAAAGRLSQQLLADPAVARFASQANGPVSLTYEAGQFSLRDGSGAVLPLAADSPLHQTARRLHQVQALVSASGAMPGVPLPDLANALAREPVATAVWPLT